MRAGVAGANRSKNDWTKGREFNEINTGGEAHRDMVHFTLIAMYNNTDSNNMWVCLFLLQVPP